MQLFRQRKYQILKGIYYFSVFFLASGFSYVAFADPPGSAYAPGATLDPSCAPGSTNCTVSTTVTASGSDGYLQFNTSGALASDSGLFWDNTNKRLGVGSSTPSAPLTVVGQVLAGYFTGTTTATSTFGGNLAINGTGTSTSNGGFDITAGCYAINGVCIGAGVSTTAAGGTGAIQFASSTSFAADASNFFWDDTNNRLGVGTSTPSSSLTVVGNLGDNPLLIASSTGGTLLSILQNGNMGVGTSTPLAKLTTRGSGTGDAYSFLATDSNNAPHMVLTDSGKLGIGSNMTTPVTRLQVGNTNALTGAPSQLFFGEYSNTAGRPIFLGNWASPGVWAFGPNSGSSDSVLRVGVTTNINSLWAANQSAFKIAVGDSVFGSSVGIGTTSPSSLLSLVGTSGSASNLLTVASSTGSSLFSVLSNGTLSVGSGADANIFVNGGTSSSAPLRNTALGYQSLNYLTTGANNNVAFGYQALYGSSTVPMTGANNFAAGYRAGYSNTIGHDNSFIGYDAGLLNTTGSNNFFTGYWTGLNNTAGSGNSFIGEFAGYYNDTGNDNFAVGNSTLSSNYTGNSNIAVGTSALLRTAGSNNIGLGASVGYYSTGSGNIFLGYQAASSTTAGDNNIAIGYDVQLASTTGSNQLNIGGLLYGTGLGTSAMSTTGKVGIGTTTPSFTLDVNGDANIAAGSAYKYNGLNLAIASTTLDNYFFGGAGNLTTTGSGNVAVGYQSLFSNTSGGKNTATGYLSLKYNTTGNNNTAYGSESLEIVTSGSDNVAVGRQTLLYTTTGGQNTGLGNYALSQNRTGTNNVALGYRSLNSATSTSNNTAIGHGSGYGTFADNQSVIDNNVTFLGYNSSRASTTASTTALTNITAIGYNAKVGASNSLVLGGVGSDAVNVGIGTTTPGSLLTVVGGAIDLTATNTEGVLGSEMITATNNRDFSSANDWVGTNWSVSGGRGVHTAGNNTYTLDNAYLSSPPVPGNYYKIYVDVRTVTSGTPGMSFSFGGTTAIPVFGQATTTTLFTGETVVVQAVSTGALTISPNNATWTDAIDNVSVKQITPQAYAQSIRNSDGTSGIELRAGGAGLYNTFVGKESGLFTVNGARNSSNGYEALMSNTSGWNNIANGYQSLMNNTTGSSNIANGYQALFSNVTGAQNIANGYRALYFNSTGWANVANGYESLLMNISGSYNIANGFQSLESNNDGDNNIASGYRSLYYNESGVGNLALGYYAGVGSDINFNEHMNRGTHVDNYSGFIGYNASRDDTVPYTTALNNAWAIGYDATVGQSNSIVLGATSTTANSVKVGIGTAFPSQTLDVVQAATGTVARFTNINGYCDINPTNTALECTSDATLKKEVTTIEGALNSISALRGVNFNWLSEDGSVRPHLGVIAQEVEQVLPGLVATNLNTGKKSVNYIGFIPVLIEAVKDLANKVASLEARIAQGVSSSVSAVKDFVVETLTAKKIATETLEMKDSENGKTYCVKITNGEWDKSEGACASNTTSTQTASVASAITPSTSSLTINGAEIVNVALGGTWTDTLGATFINQGNQSPTIYSTSTVDTMAIGTTTIDYFATYYAPASSTLPIVLHTTRSVVVVDPNAQPAPSQQEETPADTATTTPPTEETPIPNNTATTTPEII